MRVAVIVVSMLVVAIGSSQSLLIARRVHVVQVSPAPVIEQKSVLMVSAHGVVLLAFIGFILNGLSGHCTGTNCELPAVPEQLAEIRSTLAEYHRKLAKKTAPDVVRQYHAEQRLPDGAALIPRRIAILELLREREQQKPVAASSYETAELGRIPVSPTGRSTAIEILEKAALRQELPFRSQTNLDINRLPT